MAETPRSKGKTREKKRRKDSVPAAVVDLKAELRAESDKAAAKAVSSPQPTAKQQDSVASEAAATAAVQYVAPAPLYEPAEGVPPLASPSKGLAGDGSGARRDASSGSSSSSSGALTAGLGDATVAARASLEKLDLSGVSDQVQGLTGQVDF